MSEQVYILNMFPDYEPPEALKDALSQAAIVAADIDPQLNSVHIAVYAEKYIPKRMLDQVASDIARMYGLKSLRLTLTHPENQLHNIEDEELRDLFVEENSMNRGSLAGASWVWEDTELTVKLLGNGRKLLEEAVPAVCNTLRERFATPVTIKIEAGASLEGQALFDAMDSMRAKMMQERPVSVPAKQKDKQSAAVQS